LPEHRQSTSGALYELDRRNRPTGILSAVRIDLELLDVSAMTEGRDDFLPSETHSVAEVVDGKRALYMVAKQGAGRPLLNHQDRPDPRNVET
jgi:hypothetical protein